MTTDYAFEVKQRLLKSNADLRRGVMFEQGESGFDFRMDLMNGLHGKIVNAMPQIKVFALGAFCGLMMAVGFVSLWFIGTTS